MNDIDDINDNYDIDALYDINNIDAMFHIPGSGLVV